MLLKLLNLDIKLQIVLRLSILLFLIFIWLKGHFCGLGELKIRSLVIFYG